MSLRTDGCARPYSFLALALFLGLVHGLIYVRLVPPWQHYDEPNHFEYAWLVANRGRLPEPGEYDQTMRRKVARSMIRYDFFRDMGVLPDLTVEDRPVWIGVYSQLSNRPLYYLLAALPLRLFSVADVTTQLYLMRMVSLSLYLVTILAAWGIMRLLTRPGHPLQLIVPASMALLPGYTDLMTAVNNDVGAITIYSLVLWGCVHLVTRGISLVPLVLTSAAVILAYWTKETAYSAGLILLIALILALSRRSTLRKYVRVGILVVGAVVILLLLSWDDARGWYRATPQREPVRQKSEQAVHGDYVLQINSQAISTPNWLVPLFQPVPMFSSNSDEVYTLGFWMWASRPTVAQTPILYVNDQPFSAEVELGVRPSFYALYVQIPSGSRNRVWVSLSPGVNRNQPVMIYYDGLVLAEGERSAQNPPRFLDKQGNRGSWDGEAFVNLIRNGSVETAGPRVHTRVDDFGAKILPDQSRPSWIVTSLLDLQGGGWLYRLSIERLFRTFWGYFGWGHVSLSFPWAYRILALFTLFGIAGSLFGFIRRLRSCPGSILWDVLIVFGLALLSVWGAALVRSSIYLAIPNFYLPVARYVYPAIIPTITILSLGWWEWFRILGSGKGWVNAAKYVIYFGFFAGLDIVAISSILTFYTRR